MPILTIQRQFRELGRIRLGDKGPKGQPRRLSTWRLTSPDRSLLDEAAKHYGGEVVAWPEAPDGDEHQLITTVDDLEILVPPGQPLSQWNELWSGAGCQRRCDGQREWLQNVPCLCPPDPAERNELAAKGEACKPTSRLQVILPRLPDLGSWLFVSHGYYAAVELAGTVDLLAAAAQAGRMVKASLWIDQRQVKRPGQPTKKFPVPAIRIHETMMQLQASGGEGPSLIGGERIPARLETSAPLPTETALRRTDDAPPCRHDPKGFETRDTGVVCGGCGMVMAERDQPVAATGDGGAGSSAPPADTAPAAAPSPPGGGSPAPSTMDDAQSRVGSLAIQHRMVRRLDSTADWDAFDEVLRGHGLEPPPLEATPEAIAEWNALGDRIAAGEFDSSAPTTRVVDDDPSGRCQEHDEEWVHRVGHSTKNNRDYDFWACPRRDCSARPTKAWRDRQKAAS